VGFCWRALKAFEGFSGRRKPAETTYLRASSTLISRGMTSSEGTRITMPLAGTGLVGTKTAVYPSGRGGRRPSTGWTTKQRV
jgi:hypothetical protein